MDIPDIHEAVFNISSEQDFNSIAIEIFRFQSVNNPLYRDFVRHLGTRPDKVDHYSRIPFLPLSLYKTHNVASFPLPAALVFKSSGTGNSGRSKHHVFFPAIYEKSLLMAFSQIWGNPADWFIAALVPPPAQAPDSSLSWMMKFLTDRAADGSGFYYQSNDGLLNALNQSHAEKKMLFGITWALVDFAVQSGLKMPELTVVETGGMKGRAKEPVREELHTFLAERLGTKQIFSEYSMSELLSQAYSFPGSNGFACPPWMKILIRDLYCPGLVKSEGEGALNIIDLACTGSCAFVATADRGVTASGGMFEVLGRTDHSDARGCSLLAVPPC